MTKPPLTPVQTRRLADRIKRARLAADLTQREGAERAGVTVGAWSRFEQGQISPSLGSVMTIARVLGVTVGELLD